VLCETELLFGDILDTYTSMPAINAIHEHTPITYTSGLKSTRNLELADDEYIINEIGVIKKQKNGFSTKFSLTPLAIQIIHIMLKITL